MHLSKDGFFVFSIRPLNYHLSGFLLLGLLPVVAEHFYEVFFSFLFGVGFTTQFIFVFMCFVFSCTLFVLFI